MANLILIGTTIGNVEDVSFRTLRYIFEAPVVFAEDTRNFVKLKRILRERYSEILSRLEIADDKTQVLRSYREQNHDRALAEILDFLKNGTDVVFTSDAGMPGISDPGVRLVEEVRRQGFEVDVIPAPSAVTTALVLSGLPTDIFTFVGFLPKSKTRVKKVFDSIEIEHTTVIFFESPFRIVKTMRALDELFSDGIQVAACGEMTKKFQRVEKGTPAEVLAAFETEKPRGEWSVVVRG